MDVSTGRSVPLWQRILTTLSDEIDGGLYPPGAKLPTEAELSQRFGVNRHTVRRALEGLREDGRIHVRRGSGAFVTQGRFDYEIGPRTRMSRNIADRGRRADRKWLRIEEVCADRRAAEALDIGQGEAVLVAEMIATADGVPISYTVSHFALARLPGFEEALRANRSITRALATVGISDYRRRWTRLIAERPGAMIARHLQMPEIHPVLQSDALDVTLEDQPIEYGRTWFCSDRVQLVVDRSSFLDDREGLMAARLGEVEAG